MTQKCAQQRVHAGVDIGLGGAAPRAPLFEPVQTGIVPNGVYTIQSVGLGTCATGTLLAGGQTCAAGNGVGTGLAGIPSSLPVVTITSWCFKSIFKSSQTSPHDALPGYFDSAHIHKSTLAAS